MVSLQSLSLNEDMAEQSSAPVKSNRRPPMRRIGVEIQFCSSWGALSGFTCVYGMKWLYLEYRRAYFSAWRTESWLRRSNSIGTSHRSEATILLEFTDHWCTNSYVLYLGRNTPDYKTTDFLLAKSSLIFSVGESRPQIFVARMLLHFDRVRDTCEEAGAILKTAPTCVVSNIICRQTG